MKQFVGTSGYSYKEWKGNFYPEKFSDKKMLEYYAGHFNTVEINNTFYRIPKENVFEQWYEKVGNDFKFILKAPKQITHIQKLKDSESTLEYFIGNSDALKEKRGPLLFQLPPYLRKDIKLLKNFAVKIPDNILAAFEFRHESWFDDEVYDCLKEKDHALCLSDTDDEPIKKLVSTVNWGYLRLRRTNYVKKDLTNWHKMIDEQKWKEAYIFFKHEDEGKGPAFAKEFLKLKG